MRHTPDMTGPVRDGTGPSPPGPAAGWPAESSGTEPRRAEPLITENPDPIQLDDGPHGLHYPFASWADGDIITGFDSDDRLYFTYRYSKVEAKDWTMLEDRSYITLDGFTLTLMGDYTDGALVLETYYFGTPGIRYMPFLPDLDDGVALDPSKVNGMFTDDFIFRSGAEHDQFVNISKDRSGAYDDSAVGIYEIDADGNITNVRIVIKSSKDNNGDPIKIHSGDVYAEEPEDVGLFLIANGADWVKSLGDADFGFLDRTDGSVANVADGPNVTLSVNGIAVLDQLVFHSWDASLNPDGLDHVVSGVTTSGDHPKVRIGFEDRLGGDFDYQDVVITITEAWEPWEYD